MKIIYGGGIHTTRIWYSKMGLYLYFIVKYYFSFAQSTLYTCNIWKGHLSKQQSGQLTTVVTGSASSGNITKSRPIAYSIASL